MSTTQTTNQSIKAVITPEEYADVLRIIQTLRDSPRPHYATTAGHIESCSRCQATFWKSEIVYPAEAGIYFPYRTCLHCLAKRCNPDPETLAQIEKDFRYLYATPNHVQRIIAKYNEVLYNIYHHPKNPLKSIASRPKDARIYSYDITL